MRRFFLVWFLAGSIYATGQQKTVCITIDDLPVVAYGLNDEASQRRITEKLVMSLERNDIPAIGFVNEFKLYADGARNEFQIGLLRYWLDQGMDLGNHVFSHPDYNALSFVRYCDEIVRGETITTELLKRHQKKLTYFRHPYLHTGHTRERSDSLDGFLKTHGYTVAPVTIDNGDYLFAAAYSKAMMRGDTSKMKSISGEFLKYIEAKVLFYERQSQALFGRQISQVMLLHASALNADMMGELAAMFRRNDYVFVDLATTLKDPAYRTPVTVFGKWGISWIDRWAMSKGVAKSFFAGEPEVNEKLLE